jgi:S1-C subfamily serine protease
MFSRSHHAIAIRRIAVTACAVAFLAGCNTKGAMPVQKTADTPAAAAVSAPASQQAKFVLTKIASGIRSGTVIAHFPGGGLDVEGSFCNRLRRNNATLEWGGGNAALGDWSTELGEIFYDTLTARGFNIAGDPKNLFRREDAVVGADYQIGGRITDISGNICEVTPLFGKEPTGEYSGEMSVAVEWRVLSAVSQQEVYKVLTHGYFKQRQPKKLGIAVTFQGAFAAAAESLAMQQGFVDLALRKSPPAVKSASAAEAIMAFKAATLRTGKVDRDMAALFPSVVTIRDAAGHGSGFFISTDGLILTNYHVVGEASEVAVILNNGLEASGKVLRRDKARDVALIKMPVRVPNALALRMTEVTPPERVYAIGSPIKENMSSTVTAGVVSAIRKDQTTGQSYIQSDAAISGGNSGGPLVDENGNVVGISTATLAAPGAQNLNFFVPIRSALDAIALEPEK